MPSVSPDNAYEQARRARIEKNKRKMMELGLYSAAQALQEAAGGPPKPKPTPRKPRQKFEIEVEVRRSGRLRGNQPESYAEDQLFNKIGIDRVDLIDAPKRRHINIDPARLAELRDREAARAGEDAPRGPFDSGRGVRIQGGRVYDSKYGVTCHWCRQKTLEEHVTCTHPDCGGGRKLAVSFCKMCLWNRHGEDIAQAEASGRWICPPCRGSCGEGCTGCCNCGPCRRKAGLGPTHQVVKEARAAGFTNVHDYLVSRKTGQGAEGIAARKEAHTWGAWLKVPYEPATSSSDDEEGQSEQEQQQQQQEQQGGAASGVEQLAAVAAALLEPEGEGKEDAEEAGGARALPEPAAARSRRSTRAAVALAGGSRVSQYFPAAKDAEEGAALTSAAKAADAKQPSRKQRMMRKLGLTAR